LDALSAQPRFDGMKAAKDFLGRQASRVYNGCGIDIVGTGPRRKTGRCIKITHLDWFETFLLQFLKGKAKRLSGIIGPDRQVSAEGDK
jgi:hypothetical protein